MDTFEEIAGNPHIKEYFSRSVGSGRIPHALILSGEKGSGKKMFARAFAKRVLCEDPDGMRACGSCPSCRQFATGNQPDVIWVQHEKPNTIGVDDIRLGINQDIIIKPYSSKYKIYLVDEAEKMTPQAQNALLKTLEEPPQYAIIILMTANSSSFLQTILSRCVVLSIRPCAEEDVRRILHENALTGGETEAVLKLSRGNVGKAIRLSESQEFGLLLKETGELLSDGPKMTMERILSLIEKLKKDQSQVGEILDFVRIWFRDLLMLKAGAGRDSILLQSYSRTMTDLADAYTFSQLDQCEKAADEAAARLRANVNFDLTMEMLFLTMKTDRR